MILKRLSTAVLSLILIISFAFNINTEIAANSLPKLDVKFTSTAQVIETNSLNDASFIFNISRSKNPEKHVYTRLMVKIYINEGRNIPAGSLARTRTFLELYSFGDGETHGLDPDFDGIPNENDTCPKEPGYVSHEGCAAGYGYMNDHAKDKANCEKNNKGITICRSDDYFHCEIQNGDDYCPYGHKDFFGVDLKIDERLRGKSLKIVVKLVAHGYVDSNMGNDRMVVVYKIK